MNVGLLLLFLLSMLHFVLLFLFLNLSSGNDYRELAHSRITIFNSGLFWPFSGLLWPLVIFWQCFACTKPNGMHIWYLTMVFHWKWFPRDIPFFLQMCIHIEVYFLVFSKCPWFISNFLFWKFSFKNWLSFFMLWIGPFFDPY